MPDERIGLSMASAEEYARYLDGKWWKTKRRQKLKSCKHTCQECGADDVPLQVHHLHYLTLGCERDADLQALCRTCHEFKHPDKVDLTDKVRPEVKPPPRFLCACGNNRKKRNPTCAKCARESDTSADSMGAELDRRMARDRD